MNEPSTTERAGNLLPWVQNASHEKIASVLAENKETIDRLTKERDELAKCQAVCHCGQYLKDHGYFDNHGAVEMKENCPYAESMVEMKRERDILKAELEKAREENEQLNDAISTAHTCLNNNDNALKLVVGQRDQLRDQLSAAKDEGQRLHHEVASLAAKLSAANARAEHDEQMNIALGKLAPKGTVLCEILENIWRAPDVAKASEVATEASITVAKTGMWAGPTSLEKERDTLRAKVATLKGERDAAITLQGVLLKAKSDQADEMVRAVREVESECDELTRRLAEAEAQIEKDKYAREEWATIIKKWAELCNDLDVMRADLQQTSAAAERIREALEETSNALKVCYADSHSIRVEHLREKGLETVALVIENIRRHSGSLTGTRLSALSLTPSDALRALKLEVAEAAFKEPLEAQFHADAPNRTASIHGLWLASKTYHDLTQEMNEKKF